MQQKCASWYLWRKRGWRGCKRIPKTSDLVKIRAKSMEIWAKCGDTFVKSLFVVWFYKNGTRNQSA